MVSRNSLFRLAAAAFLITAVYHLAAMIVPKFAAIAYPPSYPMWRHAVFIIINTTFAAWFLTRPSWLIWPYTILVFQIFNGHGIDAWTLWQHERRIDWPSVVSVLGSTLGLWLLLVDRADRRRNSASQTDPARTS